MLSVTGKDRSQVCSGQGIQDKTSYLSSSVPDDKNLPEGHRVRAIVRASLQKDFSRIFDDGTESRQNNPLQQGITDAEIITEFRDKKKFIRQICHERRVGIHRVRKVLDKNGLRTGACC